MIAAARSYIGTPFKHQGRSRDGIDCVGLLVLVARDLGFSVIDRPVYPRAPKSDLLESMVARQGQRAAGWEPGCIVLYGKSFARHAAIYGDGTIIHAVPTGVIEVSFLKIKSIRSYWKFVWPL